MRKVVGIHSVEEVLKVRPAKVKSICFRKDYATNPQLKSLFDFATKKNLKPTLVSQQELEKVCEGHQGVMLEVSENVSLDWESLEKKEKCLLLALDGLEDPQNLGNILRSAWLLGVDGILMTENRSVGLTPTVCKIASGGAEHVAVDTYNQLYDPLRKLKEKGFWIYGLSEKADNSIWKTELHPKTILVAGSEAKGMKTQTVNECDELVKIPQKDALASLNVATSLAIVIGEYSRQHIKT